MEGVMSITNATALRKNLFEYLENTAVNDETVIITTKNGNVALVSEDYLRSLEETCFLYGIPGMKESIIEGASTPLSDCKSIDWKKRLS